VVGRESVLGQLHEHLKIADSGKRQFVFVTGEPGVGKTTLVDAFARSLPRNDSVVIPQGQCIEQYGSTEAYLPFIDALEQLCHSDQNKTIGLLGRYAPS
jgi:predicted ATPase